MLSPRFFIYELFDPIKEKIVLHTTIILDSISLLIVSINEEKVVAA